MTAQTASGAPFIFSTVRQVDLGSPFFLGSPFGFHHRFGSGFCGPSFGFGFDGFGGFNCFGGSFFNSWGWPLGLGYGDGFYNLGYSGYGYAQPVAPIGQGDSYEVPSAPGTYMPDALTPAEPQQASTPKPVTLLALKDGSMYGVTDYWLDHGELHYVTSYGGENAVALDGVDLDKTVELNSANGVDFVLRNAPAARPAPPAPLLLPLEPLPYPDIIF